MCGESVNPVIHLQLIHPSSSWETDNQLLECVVKESRNNGVAIVVAKYLRDELKIPPPRYNVCTRNLYREGVALESPPPSLNFPPRKPENLYSLIFMHYGSAPQTSPPLLHQKILYEILCTFTNVFTHCLAVFASRCALN